MNTKSLTHLFEVKPLVLWWRPLALKDYGPVGVVHKTLEEAGALRAELKALNEAMDWWTSDVTGQGEELTGSFY